MTPAGGDPPLLGTRTWEEVAAVPGLLVAVPLGSTEQHGPHLPLDTDTRVAVELAERLAAARTDTLVAPALPYGSSGEHAGFAGTLSIGQEAVEQIILALARNLGEEVRGLILVSAHGGNAEPIARAARQAGWEGLPLLAWPDPDPRARDARPAGTAAAEDPRLVDLHAGYTETSVMLHLAPDLVRLDHAAPGGPREPAGLMDALRSGGVRAVSANGVLGDPAGASAEEGARILKHLAGHLIGTVEERFGPASR